MANLPRKRLELDFKEYCLIMALRNRYRYGQVVILMRDGMVQRILKAFESDELDKPILDKE